MHAERRRTQKGDVPTALDEERQPEGHEQRAPCHEAELVHHEPRELNGPCLADALPRLGEPVDLGGRGAHHHGREVAEEDAARLDRHQVAHADRTRRIAPDGDGIGRDAEHEVQKHGRARCKKPGRLHGPQGVDELRDLSGCGEEGEIQDGDRADERRAAVRRGPIGTVVDRPALPRRLAACVETPGHGPPLQPEANRHIVPTARAGDGSAVACLSDTQDCLRIARMRAHRPRAPTARRRGAPGQRRTGYPKIAVIAGG